MPVAVFHTGMKFQSGNASNGISRLASVVISATPFDLGGMVVCLATPTGGGVFVPLQLL